jgi:hypothetical protein
MERSRKPRARKVRPIPIPPWIHHGPYENILQTTSGSAGDGGGRALRIGPAVVREIQQEGLQREHESTRRELTCA